MLCTLLPLRMSSAYPYTYLAILGSRKDEVGIFFVGYSSGLVRVVTANGHPCVSQVTRPF